MATATARAERRLAAILAADVVGYSRLIEQDETATLAALRTLRQEVIDPLLAEHHGRIVKLMGDGAIAEFGSVVDAVCCAVAIQKGVAAQQADTPAERRIVFRIGINLSDVVVEGDDLLGDGVNVAARLEQICESGGVLVSGTAYDHLQGKLDLPLDFAGEQHVKNIARPVRTYRVRLDNRSVRPSLLPRKLLRPTLAAASVLIVLVLAASGVWWFWPVESGAARAGLAVLPFTNLNGDETTSRLADGITEDIITDLSRFRDLDVIARNSTFIYKGKPVDVRQIGRELNVGYVLEGSLQRQGDQIRVTAQLIDVRTGAHVWSNRWDRATQDIFAVQSEVSERVASRLGGVLSLGAITTAEVQRARRRAPADLTAYEHYLLAAEAKGQRTPATTRTGLEHAEKAIALDPALARAYGIRGWLRYFTISDGTDWASTMEQVGADFRRAVALDPMDAEAWAALGGYLVEMGRFAEGAAELTRAVELSPMHGHVLAVAAAYLPWAGKPDEAVALADRALRLDPHMTPANLGGVSEAYFFARRFDRAVEIINSIPAASRSRGKLLLLTLSYAFLDRKEEASAAKAEFVGRYGTVSAEQLANEGFVFARPEEESLFRDGFGKAGLPICATDEQLAKYSKPKRLPECART